MKAIEFQTQIGADNTVVIPAGLATNIPAGQTIRVLLLIAETEEDQEWEHLAATEFGLGYADSDAVYDQLSNR